MVSPHQNQLLNVQLQLLGRLDTNLRYFQQPNVKLLGRCSMQDSIEGLLFLQNTRKMLGKAALLPLLVRAQ
jgi:hypothetical protein